MLSVTLYATLNKASLSLSLSLYLSSDNLTTVENEFMWLPDSHKFVHYHWIRVYINHARAEIARVGIRYSLFQKQEKIICINNEEKPGIKLIKSC